MAWLETVVNRSNPTADHGVVRFVFALLNSGTEAAKSGSEISYMTTAKPSSVRRTLEDLNGPIYPKVFPIGAGRFNFVA